MAVVVRPYLVDDLAAQDDPRAEVPADETIRFAVNGREYEIDLRSENARQFYGMIRPYQEAGRRVKRPGNTRTAAQRSQTARIREWAKVHGYTVKPRGRIPRPVVAEYELTHS